MNFNQGGFIDPDQDNDLAAMESEVYVDGKVQVGHKKKNKKKKGDETNYCAEACGIVRCN